MVVREHNIYGVPCKDYTTWTLSLTLTLTHSACVTSRRWLAIFIVLWETVSVLVEFINQHRRQWILTVWRSVTVCWCLCSSVMFWSILHVPVCCVLSVCHRLHNLCLLSRSCWLGGAKLRWIMCFSILCHDMLINAVLFMNFSCCIESCVLATFFEHICSFFSQHSDYLACLYVSKDLCFYAPFLGENCRPKWIRSFCRLCPNWRRTDSTNIQWWYVTAIIEHCSGLFFCQ